MEQESQEVDTEAQEIEKISHVKRGNMQKGKIRDLVNPNLCSFEDRMRKLKRIGEMKRMDELTCWLPSLVGAVLSLLPPKLGSIIE